MIDNIVVSTDEHFKHFTPIACMSWKKFFPELNIKIAFVTERSEDDLLCEKMKEYGDLYRFKPVKDIPTANQAKLARHYLASLFVDEVSSIEDIDTAPLQRKFWEDKFSKRKKNHMLAVGAELKVFSGKEKGKFPISTMTAEGHVFQSLFNPEKLNFEEFIKSFVGVKKFDKKENINNKNFSDESLVRYLRSINNINIHNMKRAVNIKDDWIDRAWWNIIPEKLNSGGYVCCNFKRPYEKNMSSFTDIVKYISPGSKPPDLLL